MKGFAGLYCLELQKQAFLRPHPSDDRLVWCVHYGIRRWILFAAVAAHGLTTLLHLNRRDLDSWSILIGGPILCPNSYYFLSKHSFHQWNEKAAQVYEIFQSSGALLNWLAYRWRRLCLLTDDYCHHHFLQADSQAQKELEQEVTWHY